MTRSEWEDLDDDGQLETVREIEDMAARLAKRVEALEAALAALLSAAACIRHWHDGEDGGMVVSAEKVRALWAARDQARMALAGEGAR